MATCSINVAKFRTAISPSLAAFSAAAFTIRSVSFATSSCNSGSNGRFAPMPLRLSMSESEVNPSATSLLASSAACWSLVGGFAAVSSVLASAAVSLASAVSGVGSSALETGGAPSCPGCFQRIAWMASVAACPLALLPLVVTDHCSGPREVTSTLMPRYEPETALPPFFLETLRKPAFDRTSATTSCSVFRWIPKSGRLIPTVCPTSTSEG